MTISTTSNTVVAQGNGLTTTFDFTFPVPLASELNVYLTSTGVTTLLQPNQYSVTGIGSPNGGAVVYPLVGSPIPSGSFITIQRVVSYQQLTSLVNQSGYYPNVVENALDYLTMQTQQLAEMAQLALTVPPAAATPNLVLPGATARANQLVGFDVNGNATTYPISASVGAGNLTSEGPFVANVNFTPGVTTSLTLSQAYGSVANVQVHFDTEYQGTDQYSLNGNTIAFTSPIPVGINKVYIVGGTTLSLYVPPNGTVGDAQLSWGRILKRVVGSIAALALLNVSVYQEAFATDYGLGYGGGGSYSYNAAISQASANGGTIVAAAGGVGCWVLQKGSNVGIETFGAAPNGTDASTAINAAIASGETRITAQRGVYTVTHALNFTNRNSTPLIFSGAGSYFQQSTGTTLLFKTGTWMSDMTGCQFLHLEHMRWYSDGTTGFSTMGALYARSTTVQYAMYNTMFKMIIELPSSNGSASGSVALANNCAENFQCDQCWFVADAPYASTLANELNFVSVYTAVGNTIFSNTDKTFRQCVFQSRNGYANVFYGEADSTFDQCNWTLLGSLGAGVNAAVSMNASASGYRYCANLRFTGDFESFPAIAYLAGNTQNINIDVTTSGLTGSASVVPFNNTTHDGFRLKVNQLSGAQTNLILSTGAGVVMNNAEIYIAAGQTLLDGNLTLNGGIVYGGSNDLSNPAVLTVNAASSFRASYANSTLTGSVSWTPGAVPGNSTVVTLVSVPGAVVGKSYVRVMPPYAIPFCVASAYVTSAGSVQLELSNVNGSASAAFGAGTWTVEVNKVYA